MEDRAIARVLETLFRELVDGVPRDPSYMLNTGDVGLLSSLDTVAAEDASRRHAGGASIAAHVHHLWYGLTLLNAWKDGAKNPWAGANWTASWKKTAVSDAEWQQLRTALRNETARWCRSLGAGRELDETALTYMIASVAHLAYHLGAVRQMDRAIGGPAAEAELALRERQRKA
jgi:hypothetical protein